MNDNPVDLPPDEVERNHSADRPDTAADEIAKLRGDFQSRLVAANLRTEAVKAGMVDLDGLKLIDQSKVRLDDKDKVVDGHKIMEDLRRNKPWLFAGRSSSNAISAPASQPVRPKTALEMTDEEYAAARRAVVKYQL